MRKIFYILIFILTAISLNMNFDAPIVNGVAVAQETIDETIQQALAQPEEDILEQPVFQQEQQPTKVKQVTGKISSLIIKLIGAVALFIVALISLSFIWLANLQRRKEKRKKTISANPNVIDAVENFAKLRIK